MNVFINRQPGQNIIIIIKNPLFRKEYRKYPDYAPDYCCYPKIISLQQFLGQIQYSAGVKAFLAQNKSSKWENIEDIPEIYKISGFPVPEASLIPFNLLLP